MDNANEKAVLDAAMEAILEASAEITREEDAVGEAHIASFTDPEDIKAFEDPAVREIFKQRAIEAYRRSLVDQASFDRVHANRKRAPGI